MIHAESYLVCNMLMCACALPLGGRLAGLPAPQKKTLALSTALSGALGVLPLCASALSPLALLGLPGSVAMCFHRHGAPACVRCTFTTLLAGMLLGGAMSALLSAGLSASAAAAAAAGIALAACLLIRLLPGAMCEIRQVELRVEEQAILLPAMLDSGNLLRDPVTGKGVLVVPGKAVQTLFPQIRDPENLTSLPLGFRLLQVRTAAGSALWPMFRPDVCRIYVNGRACDAELLVAVAGREYSGVQALVPMSALPAGALSP